MQTPTDDFYDVIEAKKRESEEYYRRKADGLYIDQQEFKSQFDEFPAVVNRKTRRAFEAKERRKK